MSVKVSEIFYSIQGEGPNIGKPAVFLRTAICNLKCSWCDTKYTWDWENYDYNKEVKIMNLADIEKEVMRYDSKHLVVTGGEPLIQQESLVPLLSSLKQQGYFIEVETNGTVSPIREMEQVVDQWNVSPKTSNSGNSQELREVPDCYMAFRHLSNSYFKYVVQNSNDINEIENLIAKYHLAKEKIILMPEASNIEELTERSKWLVELAKKSGYRFTNRLQIQLWGNQRGK